MISHQKDQGFSKKKKRISLGFEGIITFKNMHKNYTCQDFIYLPHYCESPVVVTIHTIVWYYLL
jgi:hypothetical protein